MISTGNSGIKTCNYPVNPCCPCIITQTKRKSRCIFQVHSTSVTLTSYSGFYMLLFILSICQVSWELDSERSQLYNKQTCEPNSSISRTLVPYKYKLVIPQFFADLSHKFIIVKASPMKCLTLSPKHFLKNIFCTVFFFHFLKNLTCS